MKKWYLFLVFTSCLSGIYGQAVIPLYPGKAPGTENRNWQENRLAEQQRDSCLHPELQTRSQNDQFSHDENGAEKVLSVIHTRHCQIKCKNPYIDSLLHFVMLRICLFYQTTSIYKYINHK